MTYPELKRLSDMFQISLVLVFEKYIEPFYVHSVKALTYTMNLFLDEIVRIVRFALLQP